MRGKKKMTETDWSSYIFPVRRGTDYFPLVVSDINSTEKGTHFYSLSGAKKSRIWNSVILYIYNKINLKWIYEKRYLKLAKGTISVTLDPNTQGHS